MYGNLTTAPFLYQRRIQGFRGLLNFFNAGKCKPGKFYIALPLKKTGETASKLQKNYKF